MMTTLRRELVQGLRRLAGRKAHTMVVIATLTLVIGAGGAVLAVVNATLVRPLPFPQADRLARLYTLPPGVSARDQFNPLHSLVFVRFVERLRQAEGVVAVWAYDRAIGGDGEPENVRAAQVSPGTFAMLGGTPVIGRTFTEEEDRAGAPVAVLSWALWQRRYGGRADVIGAKVLIDRQPFEVIGVMDRAFEPGYIASDLWTPLHIDAGNLPLPNASFLQTFVRLRPGATVAQLDAEVKAVMADIAREGPPMLRGWTGGAMSLREFQFGSSRPALLVLLAAVALLAALASANLVNLALADVMSRRGELALRAALGARRTEVLRLQALEGLVLAAVGTVAGLLVASVGVPALLSLDPQATIAHVDLDWRVQLAGAALALAVSMTASLWPMLRLSSRDLGASLLDAGRRTAGSRRDGRLRQALVAAQVALAVVLLSASASLVGGFNAAAQVDPGFDPRGVLGGQVRLSPNGNSTVAARAALASAVVEHLRAIPGVVDASTTTNFFVPGNSIITMVDIEGRPSPDGQSYPVQFRRVGPGYFRTMRIAVKAGRTFTDADGPDAPPVTVVSEAFARRFWLGEDPVGRRVFRGGLWLTVIGVVGDVRDVSFTLPPEATLYVNYLQQNTQNAPISIVLRAAGDPLALATAVRAAVFAADPTQPVDHLLTMDQFLADSLGPERFRTTLLSVYAALALLLAALGVYGVATRAAAERTREMGVRLALGAAPGHVWRLVVGQAMAVVLGGAAVGAVAAAASGVALARILPNLEAGGAWPAAQAAAVLSVAALVACAVPARRVLRVDPSLVLRE